MNHYRKPLLGIFFSAALVATILALGIPSAHAAPAVIFTVNSTLDQVDDNPGDGICHTASNVCTLRAATMEANRTSGLGATINIPAGTFFLTIPAAGTDDETTGDLNLTTPTNGSPTIFIVGQGASQTIIDANQLDRVFDIAIGRQVNIRSLTIRNGYLGNGLGGGIRNQGSPTIDSVVIENNSAVSGGGIYNYAGMTIRNSIVRFNQALVNGGGIYNESTFFWLKNSVVNNNVATGWGGGIAGYVTNSNINVKLEQSFIFNNNANAGGGIGVGAGLDWYIGSSTIASNTATTDGGGVWAATGKMLFVNTTISGNSAKNNGGGIHKTVQSNGLGLYSVTIANNQADSDFDGAGIGGGIYNEGSSSTDVINTIIAGNFASSCAGMICFAVAHDCYGLMRSMGSDLIQTLTSDCGLYGAGGYFNIDPRLSPLQDNGGPTPTHALLRGSPAIDHGEVGGCRDDQNALLLTDQRGVNRHLNGRCDIGAYESPALLFLPLIKR